MVTGHVVSCLLFGYHFGSLVTMTYDATLAMRGKTVRVKNCGDERFTVMTVKFSAYAGEYLATVADEAGGRFAVELTDLAVIQ